MEEEKGGISFGDICRIIFSQKWLALIIAAVITVAGTLALYFGYNKIKEEYVADFMLVLPNDDFTSATYQYPDGQPFNYLDLVSKSTLNAVVEAGDYGIDVDGMVGGNYISVSENLQVIPLSSESNLIQRKYTIKVSARFFKNELVARDFLTDVANYPCKYLSNLKIEYYGALKYYETADDYYRQIEYLNEQVEFIKENYELLIEQYGKDFNVGNGALIDRLNAVNLGVINNNEFKNLESDLFKNGYLKGKQATEKDKIIENYTLELEKVKRDIQREEYILNAMKTNSDSQVNSEVIQKQAKIVAALIEKQNNLEIFVDNKNGNVHVDVDDKFADKLEVVYDKLLALTETLQNDTVIVYKNSSKASFVNSNVVAIDGHMNIIVSIAASLVAGLVIAAIAAYIVGWNKLKKANPHTENTVVENEQTDGRQA